MAAVIVGQGVSPRSTDVTASMAEVADAATGEWYILPDGLHYVTVEIIPAVSAKVQHTLDIAGAVAGTATGVDWDAGTVTVATTQLLQGGGAVRLVSVSDTVTGFIKGVTA